ncbi:PREDICTED: neurotrypsin-like [Amphimedon queenslandica]|uniref:SRCR domain-containing protein n=2 Tax=Amphimedon queenslandica TaxID=400682 RepID=A0AAN0ITJ7_AMPQE|nr:PREDICTED: neurotrypsin-like [Amphimedon queenslandica]|eukprot:XP_011409192.2 PREDICTED: neurotrypsin-like [Amphimedon queenslandica]
MGIYNLSCTGNETSLWECQFTTTYNGRYCGQSNDASVFCMSNTTQYSNCTDGDVRLIGGSTSNEGNVQICYKNTWGSVCDDSWGTADSNVVCRQLGLQPYGSSAYYSNRYVVHSPFVYGLFYCSGIEKTLLHCPKSSSNYLLSCQNYEIAGAQCIGTCTDGRVRIRGTYNTHIGRVEVCVNGTWVTVCDENWDDNDAAVICHQFGHSAYGAMAAYGSIISDSYPTRVYGVNCTGSERELFDCPVHLLPPGSSYSSCSQNDAGVICQGSQTMYSNCTNGDVRLRDGATLNQGRVEICVNNAWGTVCDDGWGELNGNVVCMQLGYQQVGKRPDQY